MGNCTGFYFIFTLEYSRFPLLASRVQQSDPVIHIQVSILSQVRSPFRLLQNIDLSSLCLTLRSMKLRTKSALFPFYPQY